MDSTPRPHTGRKRSEASRLAVQHAVLELLRSEGYAALTFDKVAALAKVGKQTIYRWWSSKGALVLDALADETSERITEPDTGTLEGDLSTFLRRSFEVLHGDRPTEPILKALVVETQVRPEFLEQFRHQFIERRRQALRAVLERAHSRGELPAWVDRELLIDQVFGALWYRLLFGHAPLDRHFADALAHHLANFKATPSEPSPRRKKDGGRKD
ncbi:TetR/AcrR family transcriptional regulator [Vitiosangium sp. GDMCC 1.1324]|uniref:TetR/AcrR family transcriptional regulator n=1 Tax=Vitiosangium sp. (strain GDMCC 1.1324) TaxID=2138576 RepID=UPI000D388A7C|nr:TetR/AcrR family transcriptional regulator [Vitiosangium sp. GDMCC 1.1324]PTL81517.1 TetR family transcriptional regulator [Vitiosangium sp. GDMCC 1.1324]